jgi:hypothetical protein
LLYADDFRDYVGLTVELEVLSDALSAEELYAFEAKMTDDFGRMRFAVVGT